ncbi:MAG TPA: polysaccharide pyruvyl transferase family protein, partial [Solirubrobacteraceae bacterium]|nr:polysaccharide pyruvyl transferase family protein [Solirubrobacteraceae bacterium]
AVPTLALDASRFATAMWFARLCWFASWLGLGRPPQRAEQLRDAHAVCLLGGSNLFVQGRHRIIGLARLFQLLAPALIAQREGIPTYLLGHTIGPLCGPTASTLTRIVLSRATLITVRERRSAELLAELGIPESRYRVAPDLAFALTPSSADNLEVMRRAGLDQRFLALSVRQHPYLSRDATNTMLSEVAQFARDALYTGHVKRVAVIAQARGPTSIEDDRPVSRQLAADIGPEAVFLEEDLSASELANVYGAASAVVAVRLHAAIISMTADTPAVAIGYFTSKTEGVFELLGMPEMRCEFADVTAGFLQQRLQVMLSRDSRVTVHSRAEQARTEVQAIVGALR